MQMEIQFKILVMEDTVKKGGTWVGRKKYLSIYSIFGHWEA